jgi:hypothetical protein
LRSILIRIAGDGKRGREFSVFSFQREEVKGFRVQGSGFWILEFGMVNVASVTDEEFAFKQRGRPLLLCLFMAADPVPSLCGRRGVRF